MKFRPRAISMLLACAIALAALVCVNAGGCSRGDLEQISADQPRLAPATQAVEKLQVGVDSAADVVLEKGPVLQGAANAAGDAGVPFAKIAGYGIGGLVTLAAGWKMLRRGNRAPGSP